MNRNSKMKNLEVRFTLTCLGTMLTSVTCLAQNETEARPDSTDNFLIMTQNLDEVVIAHQAPMVRLKTDKVTYQVTNDAESKTQSVLEMLRKVPMVTVDGRGNITVNGSAQFKVYVDGRLNTTLTRNPSKTLRNMPASQVRNIEVITNPGAQYDAEGAGGVLCIYTTKKESAKRALMLSDEEAEEATAGSAHATAGLKSWGADVSLSHQKKRWSWDMNLNGEYWYSPDTKMTSEATGQDIRQWMEQKSNSKAPGVMADFGIGYEVDSVRSLHANVSLNWFGMKDQGDPHYIYSGGLWGKSMDFTGRQVTRMDEVGIDGSIDYQRTWGDRGRFFVNYQISHNPNNSDMENRYLFSTTPSTEIQQILRDNRTETRERTTAHHLMSDVTLPLAENHLLNTGMKLTADVGNSRAKELRSDPSGSWTELAENSLHFQQQQYITAAYAEWDARWGWLGMKSGLRYEHTWQKSNYLKGQGSNFSLNYGSLVPSVSLTANASESSIFGLNYTMRIRRPGISELDPYVNTSDPTQLVYGNPHLEAQHLHNATLVYTLSTHKVALRMSLGHAWSNDGIAQYSELKEGRIHTTYGNVSKQHTTSLNTYLSWSMTGKTRLTLNGQVAYCDLRSPKIDARNSGWQGNANVGLQQNLPLGLKWTTNLEWMSRHLTLQGHNSSMTMLSTTLMRSFCHDKWSIALSGMTGLGHGGKMVWESETRSKDFTNTMRYIEPMQDITLGVTYNFGGTKAKRSEKHPMSPDFDSNVGSSTHQMRHRGR